MQVGSSYLYDAGTKYYTPLGDGRYLVAREKNDSQTQESSAAKTSDISKVNQLSTTQEQLLSELQTRDAQVRQHEAAHQAAGAPTGAVSYTYQEGPDGKMYAIGGEVSVTVQSGSTPQETIQNAQAVISSAMAPGDPSAQDHAVASSARMMMLKAQQEKSKDSQEELGKNTYIQNAQEIQKEDQDKEPFELLA